MTASLPPDWEPSTAASSSAPPPAQGRPPGDPGEVGKEIGVKNAGMGQGASEELEPPRTFIIRQVPLQGSSHRLLNGPLKKRWEVERWRERAAVRGLVQMVTSSAPGRQAFWTPYNQTQTLQRSQESRPPAPPPSGAPESIPDSQPLPPVAPGGSGLTRIKAVGESVGSLSGGPSPLSSPDSSVFPRDSSSSSMVTCGWRDESVECRPAGGGEGVCARTGTKAENGHEDLRGLQRPHSQYPLQHPSAPPPHPSPWGAPGPGQTPEGAEPFPSLVWILAASSVEGSPSPTPMSTPRSTDPTASATTRRKTSWPTLPGSNPTPRIFSTELCSRIVRSTVPCLCQS